METLTLLDLEDLEDWTIDIQYVPTIDVNSTSTGMVIRRNVRSLSLVFPFLFIVLIPFPNYYFRFLFPLPWVILPLPRWLIGLFMCLDSFSTSIRFANCSMVSAS